MRETVLARYTADELDALRHDWRFWARPNQLPPETDWFLWLLLAGRGFGKTRAGAEWIHDRVWHQGARWITLIAATPADARDIMIEGESGILNVGPPAQRPEYEPSKRLLTWSNGAVGRIRSGHDPDSLRGVQSDTGWADEMASWEYPRETWDNFLFGLRLGTDPRVCVTTTPKPILIVKDLYQRCQQGDGVLTTGSTYENRANLAEPFFREIVSKYEGTTLGQQELYAQILSEASGALWTRAMIDAARVATPPTLRRVVVGIDPAAKSKREHNETGIIAAGLGVDGHAYVLQDGSGRLKPDAWAKRAVAMYHDLEADRVIGEDNNGGEMVEHTIHTVDDMVAVSRVTATRGKATRAEPIQALYQRGMVHHVGTFGELEDQMCTWVPYDDGGQESPDRLDAMVWAVWHLLVRGTVPVVAPAGLSGASRWR